MQGTDLLAEVHQQRIDSVKQHRRSRRRRGYKITFLLIMLAVFLAASGVVAKWFYDQHKIETSLQNARVALTVGSAATLAEAADMLKANLEIRANHPETLATLALVRAHQAAEGLVELAEAEAALLRAANAGEASPTEIARSIAAHAGGDAPEGGESTAPHDAHLAAVHAHERAYADAMVALRDIDDPEAGPRAIASLEAALDTDPDWPKNRRMLAAAYFRVGQADEALARLGAAREAASAHFGLAVDEALYHAALQRELGGVLRSTQALLERPDEITPRDRARARIARGIAQFHRGKAGAGVAEIEQGWEALPPWDNLARDLALEAAVAAGRVAEAKQWLSACAMPKTTVDIYAAWFDLSRGDAKTALELLAKMPQTHPRVAQTQALALVEQRRFAEALPWVERGQRQLPARYGLEVAGARARIELDQDVTKTAARLEVLAKEHPYAHRVWTGLAEARIKSKADGVDKALTTAADREALPAEATLILAQRRAEKAVNDPSKAGKAIELFRKAAEYNPHMPRYRSGLGMFLSKVGHEREAIEVLKSLAEPPVADPLPVLRLVQLMGKEAIRRGKPPPPDAQKWLELAAAAGAPQVDVERERARLELARNNTETLARANGRLIRLLQQQPRDVDSRVLHGRVLLAFGDIDGARTTLRMGIRRTLRKLDGPLYIALARVERADNNKRPAARMAYTGWKKMIKQPGDAADLVVAAKLTARAYQRIRKPKVARGIATDLVERAPSSADAWQWRAEVQLAGGFEDAACVSAKRAVKLAPESARAHATRGDCLSRLRNVKEAREAYRKAMELAEGTPAASTYKRRLRRIGGKV